METIKTLLLEELIKYDKKCMQNMGESIKHNSFVKILEMDFDIS